MADEQIINFGDAERDLNRIINQLKQADQVILKISADALAMGRNLGSINLPSDLSSLTSENARLTAQIQAQAQALAQLQTQYTNLNQRRQRSSQQTAEEAVNQGILNRNAREAALANSTLAGAYARLSAQQSIAARNLQNVIARGRTGTQTQREYNRELRNAQSDFNELNRRVLAADRAIGRFNRNVGNYPKAAFKGFKDLLGAFGLVGGVTAIAAITKDIYEQVKAQESLDLALKQVTGSQDEFARAQAFLMSLSERFGVEINTLTSAYQKFYVSAIDKLKTKQIEDIFTSVTKAAANLGLTVENQDRVFTALNQMLSKGKVQAEELRQQLGDALPGAIGIMKRAYQALHPEQQITSAQFEKLMKDGKILASEVLPQFAKELEKTYNLEKIERVDNLAAAQNRLTNAWKNFIRELNDGKGTVSQVFAQTTVGMGRMLNYLTEAIKDVDEQQREKYAKFRTDAYKEEYDALSKLGDKAKETAADREKELTPLLVAETKEKQALLERNYHLRTGAKLRADGLIWDTKAREEYAQNVKQIKFLNNDLNVLAGRLSAIKKIRTEKPKGGADPEEASKAELKAIEDNLKALALANRKEIELRILKNETILNGEYSTYEEQYKALEKYNKDKLLLIELDYQEQLRLAKGNANKIKVADFDMQMAVIKQAQDGFNKLKTIRKKENDDYISEIKEIEDFLKKYHDDKDAREEASQELNNKVTEANFALIDKNIEKLKELKDATKEYLDSFTGEFFSNAGFGETYETFFKKIDDGTGKMTTKFKQLLEGAGADKWKVYFNSIAQTAQETFNFISEASQKNFDAENERLQSQYDVALKFAGDNKEAQEKLAEDLEKRKKEIANREAKAKKQQALFNIAIDTAQAVVEALPNYVLAAIIAGIGLVQLAAVSAQEIPQYWMGGTHDKGGLMMVNDGKGTNWKETYVTPDGNIHKPQTRNAIIDAPAGTKIYTHDQWMDWERDQLMPMLRGNNIMPYQSNQVDSGISKDDLYEVMNSTLGGQVIERSNLDANGFSKYTIKRGNMTRRNINRANGRR